MRLSKTKLVFTAADKKMDFPPQSIKLSRTKIFKLVSEGRYFIMFKEEVNKVVNIL